MRGVSILLPWWMVYTCPFPNRGQLRLFSSPAKCRGFVGTIYAGRHSLSQRRRFRILHLRLLPQADRNIILPYQFLSRGGALKCTFQYDSTLKKRQKNVGVFRHPNVTIFFAKCPKFDILIIICYNIYAIKLQI